MKRKHVERTLATGVLALGAAGFYWLHVRSGLEWRPEALRDYVATLGVYGPLAFIAIMALRPFLVLPSWLVLFACGMLFGPWLGAIYGAFGGLIGGAIIFFVARAFGRDAVQGRIGGALRIFDDLLARRGAPWLALYTAVPISPLTPVYASAGVSRMSVTPFCVAIGLGLLPRAGVYTFAGQATVNPSLLNIVLAVGIALAAVAVTWRMRRSFKST